MIPRKKEWKVMGLHYSRIGYVEHLSFIGLTLYRRCGSIVECCGIHWREE